MLAECLRWYLRILFSGCGKCDRKAITYRLFFPSFCCLSSALKRYGITLPAWSYLVPMSTGSLLSFWFCWIWGWIWMDNMMYSSFYCLVRTWLTEPGVMMKNPKCREEAPPEQTRSIHWFSLFDCRATKCRWIDGFGEELEEGVSRCRNWYYKVICSVQLKFFPRLYFFISACYV